MTVEISILLPILGTDANMRLAQRAIESVHNQIGAPSYELLVEIDDPIAPEGPWRLKNELLRSAKGQWVFWLDHDDTIEPECLGLLHMAAVEHDAFIAHGSMRTEGEIVPPGNPADLYAFKSIHHPILHRNNCPTYCPWPAAADYEFLLRSHREGKRFVAVPSAVYNWTRHPTQISTAKAGIQADFMRRAQEIHRTEVPCR
jgi:hypothetical protein